MEHSSFTDVEGDRISVLYTAIGSYDHVDLGTYHSGFAYIQKAVSKAYPLMLYLIEFNSDGLIWREQKLFYSSFTILLMFASL